MKDQFIGLLEILTSKVLFNFFWKYLKLYFEFLYCNFFSFRYYKIFKMIIQKLIFRTNQVAASANESKVIVFEVENNKIAMR